MIEWDAVYKGRRMAAYPDTALVRFIAKHYYDAPDRSGVRFLDLGAGAGASSLYLAREGFSVTATDISKVALERLEEAADREGLPVVSTIEMDLASPLSMLPANTDCAIDVSSLCYVDDAHIRPLMQRIYAALKPGGRMFQIAPASDCSHGPFETFHGGKPIRARFLSPGRVADLFIGPGFTEIKSYLYWYENGDGEAIRLWVTDAIK